ncbi:hypothetical protein FB45DRAFT_780079 [Roridomyces roridus]|uniref:C2H2-type domain-containing protein n=1 Tax=Roridomyces roridus TaxID=1738132 RepID=A0AAD7CJZ3_9AGAR|nr:hypothetical protein FB45DRAFT_780079 [Roridomyces roridus]
MSMAAQPAPELEPELEIIDLTGDATDSEAGAYAEEEADTDDVSDASRAQLRTAIANVPEAHLRHVVASLADAVPSFHRALARELLGINPVTRVVVPRWETCRNCGETYDVNADDEHDTCVFHPGDMEVDEEAFPDWDEDCHGPKDTKHNRQEYPENFLWSCCDADGMAEGCVNGKHKATASKKRRLG